MEIPHDDPLVIKLKVASELVRKILIDTGSSANIKTWECLQRLKYPGRDIIPLVHLHPGFGGQTVNTLGMIRLSLRFGDKAKSKSIEVDFLVVDVPTTYNVILGRSTLHRVKAVTAPYLLQIQYEADDDMMGKIFGDQCTDHKCYIVSIRPLVGSGQAEGPRHQETSSGR